LHGAHARAQAADPFASLIKSPLSATGEALTPLKDVIATTRFRELEEDIAANSAGLLTRPWTVVVDGEVLKPRTFDIDELMRLAPMEERIYRMRCTEGWSLVIPYAGYPFAEIARRVEPTGNAKFVEFTSILDPKNLRGQREVKYISWPYVEGLRIDEAMHPLTLVALGIYGASLPKANGAPVAIRVPWKYGIKSPKAVVRIRFTEQQPQTVWTKHYPSSHSFWSNVNPEVSPRLFRSRATERRVGESGARPTLMFNGYAQQVAHLYAGMDPRAMY
jgi:sulfoxide reductase catalytic subunit YedY